MSSQSTAVLLASITESIDLFGLGATQWQIYASGTSDQVISPDSIVSVEFKGDARVSDFPVEQGAFSSYNKVMVPFEVRVVLACMSTQMSRFDFLAQLNQMRQSTDLYDISTPDNLFESVTLEHYDYRRTSTKGLTLLQVECVFKEVRQTASAAYSTDSTGSVSGVNSDSPSAADPQNNGTVTTYAYGSEPGPIFEGVQ